jgi:8-oxo-dGTP pyrophosphatase MutT (NUDIX family)
VGVESVRAAGGVISRRNGQGETEVLLIHRFNRTDWTFPKGKVEAGESDEEAARREVEEETALQCSLGDELPSATYRDNKGRFKTVRYWAMTPVGGVAEPRMEVDGVRWLGIGAARALLTYPRDRDVLDAFARRIGP